MRRFFDNVKRALTLRKSPVRYAKKKGKKPISNGRDLLCYLDTLLS